MPANTPSHTESDYRFPVSEEERLAVHAATSRAMDKITATIPREHWDAISAAVAAYRKQAALYAYACKDDAEFRAYAGFDG